MYFLHGMRRSSCVLNKEGGESLFSRSPPFSFSFRLHFPFVSYRIREHRKSRTSYNYEKDWETCEETPVNIIFVLFAPTVLPSCPLLHSMLLWIPEEL